MEKYQLFQRNANQKLQVADRFLNFTFRVVNEPKMLLGIIDNIYHSMDFSIASLLHLELKYKFVPPFKDDFNSRILAFKPLTQKYELNQSYLELIQKLKELKESHKECSVEFVKDGNVVMCSDEFSCEKLTPHMVSAYFKKAKLFIQEVNNIIRQNERKYRRFS